MHWFTPILQDAGARYFFLIDRSPQAMNEVLDRVAQYNLVKDDCDDVRMIAFSLPPARLRVSGSPDLAEMFDEVTDDIITLPAGVEVDRLTRECSAGFQTLQVCHQPGEATPRVAYMAGFKIGDDTASGTSIPLSLTLIEQAAAGIITVDG